MVKKIAILTPGYLPVPASKGGAVENLITYLIYFNEKKFEYKFDVYSVEDNITYNFKNTNIIRIYISKYKKILEKIINKILKILNIEYIFNFYNFIICNNFKDNNYDYIVIENNMFLYYHFKKKYKGSSKLIFHLHNSVGSNDKPKWLCKYIANSAYKILVVSDFIKRQLYSITFSSNIHVLLNVIDINMLKKQQKNQNLLNENITTFLYVGRFSKEKGLYELILAFNKLCIHNNNCILKIAGMNNYKTIYSKKINNLIKKNKKIKILGYIENNDIGNLYNECDVVVVPSICDEAFGLSSLEALVCKKVVIASNKGALPEIVNKYGILVESENFVYNLCNAMEKTMNKELRKKYVDKIHNNQKYFLKFSNELYLDNFKNILEGEQI